LKIIGIPYLLESTNTPIIIDVVETIIRNNHIRNNIVVTSRPRIIKVSLKLDIVIIWLDIWNVQSRSKAKGLINRCFNIKNYIATIQDANMNPGIPQYKNCWKWEHITFSCQAQGSKCIKYNSPHKTKYHQQFTWYYKTNFKTNPPRLEIK